MTAMPTPEETGRGAWTKRGNLLDRRTYKRGCSRSLNEVKNQDEWAVSYGVEAIRDLLDANGFPVEHVGDPGIFGPRTRFAVMSFKKSVGLKANGVVGPKAAKALIRPVVDLAQKNQGIPDNLLWGLIGAESGFDPGAIGYLHPIDLGLGQFNMDYNPDMTPAKAMEPVFAIRETGRRLVERYNGFKKYTLVDKVAWNAAVLAHNSPANALEYAKTGEYPTAQAEAYVNMVRGVASS